MKTRLVDIAKAAGVSPATVSNVLNCRNRVGDATRMKVLECSRKMGYREPAVGMVRKSVRFISLQKHGKIIIDSPFFAELISGMQQACRKNGYELVIYQLGINESAEIQSLIQDSSYPMIVLATEIHREEMHQFLKYRGPLVVLDNNFLNANSFNAVHTDNQKGGYLAGEYLITRGHTHLGMITSSCFCNNARDRLVGFEQALHLYNLTLKEEDLFSIDPSVDSAFDDMCRIINNRKSPLPTGIFAFNDMVAISAISALQSKGINVPKQISLIGMDNIPAGQLINPPLTTINVSKFAMGTKAIEHLLSLVGLINQKQNIEPPMTKTVIDVQLIERESVSVRPNQLQLVDPHV